MDEYKPSRNEQLFKEYYDKLIWETLWAHAHLKLWERLENYRTSYLKELNQAPHFFNFTMKAHLDDALLTLSRILDTSKDSLTIWKFLNFIECNKEIFSTQTFCRRKKDTPYYEDQVKSHIPITPKVIREDRQKLENLKETMDSLNSWRDKVLAHNDRQFYLKSKISSTVYPLQLQQLEKVMDTIVGILNRYSYAYDSSTLVKKFSGEDDIQSVMDSIRFKKEDRKKQLEAWKKQAKDKGQSISLG